MSTQHPPQPFPTDEGEGPVKVLVFDVNETLSDLSPMGKHFAEVGCNGGAAR